MPQDYAVSILSSFPSCFGLLRSFSQLAKPCECKADSGCVESIPPDGIIHNQGHFAEALERCRSISMSSPDHAENVFMAAMVHFAVQDYAR